MEQTFMISLKAARVNAGLSLEQAGVAIKRNKNTIHNWESGKSSIGKSEFAELCNIYGIPEQMVKQPKIEKE